MEIPQEVQDKLKCSECDGLLSCGPVYLLHETGGAICGRCSQQSEDSTESSDRTRIGPYEATASLFAFPCAFAARGCPEKVQFSLELPSHESDCKYRPFICPIAPRGSCEWFGSLPIFKEHCDEKHPRNVFENPSNLPRPELTTTNTQTYVISAFHFLFLLHIKVCVTSEKLFHSIRKFGDSKLLDKFSYELEIKGNGLRIILCAGISAIQETASNFVLINSLLDLLGGKYNESEFTIRIRALFNFCLNCFKNVDDVPDSKFCEEWQGKLEKCKFRKNNCSFVDVNKEKYCDVTFVGGSLYEHLCSSTSCRETIHSNINSVVRIKHTTTSNWNYILFSCNNIETVICSYHLSNSTLKFNLYTSLPSYELKNFKCSIELTEPQTKYTQHLIPQIKYNHLHDWFIKEKIDNFQSWNNIGIDLKINRDKI